MECKILDGLGLGNFPSVQIWTLPVIIVSSAFPAFLEHWFLARRYWNLCVVCNQLLYLLTIV